MAESEVPRGRTVECSTPLRLEIPADVRNAARATTGPTGTAFFSTVNESGVGGSVGMNGVGGSISRSPFWRSAVPGGGCYPPHCRAARGFGRGTPAGGASRDSKSPVLVGSWVTLLDTLGTVERLFRNTHVAGRLAAARVGVLRGGTLAGGLDDRLAFMPLLPRMAAVGEATGARENVLGESARYHEDQLKRAIRWLSLPIEPAIIVIVGGIVGFVYVSFFLALFSASVSGGR